MTRSVLRATGFPDAVCKPTVGHPVRSHARPDAFVNVKVTVNT